MFVIQEVYTRCRHQFNVAPPEIGVHGNKMGKHTLTACLKTSTCLKLIYRIYWQVLPKLVYKSVFVSFCEGKNSTEVKRNVFLLLCVTEV
jgi:hypothetical protein